ncbi:MAG: hypothetical protein AAF805_11720, partial [Planctomycetota bacterium]
HEAVGRDGAPLLWPGARTRLLSQRPVAMARESAKVLESLAYCPLPRGKSPLLRTVVRDRLSGAIAADAATPLRRMLDHQYQLVVLAREPQRYAFLDALTCVTARLPDSVDPSGVERSSLPASKQYRVVALEGTGVDRVALPDSLLAWSSVAALVWDDADPDALRPVQRAALVDWLHWGGALVVSGPNSLDQLRGSFLDEYLPADSGGTLPLGSVELAPLAALGATGRDRAPEAAEPWTGVSLQPRPGASAPLGLEGLVVERRVGRGRVLVTAFSLRQRELLDWRAGRESLFNAVILRRPARRFVARGVSFGPEDDFSGEDASSSVGVATLWDDARAPVALDPGKNTAVRFFARDGGIAARDVALRVEEMEQIGFGGQSVSDSQFRELAPPRSRGGYGAVRQDSPVAVAAREVLRESAGVSVPSGGFVVACLAIYLAALVPLNWAFFTAIGRVELAWVAAPLIAAAGAWVVIRQAQLDIGFVRARTEIAVLETQPDAPRGVLSRFTALYTSLSSEYEATLDGRAIARPFLASLPGELGAATPTLRRVSPAVGIELAEDTRLVGLLVGSATTELLQSEQVVDVAAMRVDGSSVAGGFVLARSPGGTLRLANRTGLSLREAFVVGRPDGLRGEPRLEGCWVGDVGPGASTPVALASMVSASDAAPFNTERAAARRLADEPGRLELAPLVAIACRAGEFLPGERRLVAWIDGVLPGMEITPRASQTRGATLVVAHLAYGVLPTPRPDANAPIDVYAAELTEENAPR